jgi:hypothetical protein
MSQKFNQQALDAIAAFLASRTDEKLTSGDVLTCCLGIPENLHTRSLKILLCGVMQENGWVVSVQWSRVAKNAQRVWSHRMTSETTVPAQIARWVD